MYAREQYFLFSSNFIHGHTFTFLLVLIVPCLSKFLLFYFTCVSYYEENIYIETKLNACKQFNKNFIGKNPLNQNHIDEWSAAPNS